MRQFIVGLVVALVAGVAAAQGGDLTFSVTEGVTYQATPKEIRDKFTPLADVIGKATGRRVKIVLVPKYNDVREGLAKQEFDVAYIHPAHVSMAEIKAGRYKAVAWTTGYTEYTVSLLVPGNAPLKSMEDLNGRTLVTPDPDSITAVMVRAMFRGEKLTATAEREPSPTTVRVITTRYQDAVPVLHRERLRAGRRDRRQCRREGVDREGRQGAAAVPAGPDQADHRVDQALGRRAAAHPRRAADAAGLEARAATRSRRSATRASWRPTRSSRARRSRGWGCRLPGADALAPDSTPPSVCADVAGAP